MTGVDGRERGRIAAGLALLLVVAGLAYALTRGDSVSPPGDGATGPKVPASESVVQIDPENGTIVATVPAPVPQTGRPGINPPTSTHSMVVGQGGVWTLRSFGSLYHIDPQRLEVRTRMQLLDPGLSFSFNIEEGLDAIWVATGGSLVRVNPATDQQELVLRIPASGTAFTADVAVGGGYVWLSTGDGRLLRLDPRTDRRRWEVGLDPIDTIVFGHDADWAADSFDGTITRYDVDTMRPEATIVVAAGVDDLVSGEVAVWALSRSVGSLTEIDVSENVAAHIEPVGEGPTGLTTGLGAVWIGDRDGVIRRIDEETRQMVKHALGAGIRAIAFDKETDTLWVDVA